VTKIVAQVDAASDELYGLAPSDFIGRRHEISCQAKADGAAEAAKQIGALRRPTTSAWVANLLARERPDEIAALLKLGAALEDAQQSRSGDRLRSLARDRRQQLDALVQAGLALADRAGHSARAALPTELRETLAAALGEPAVAEELRAGRLTVAHRPGAVGFGDWSLGDQASGPSNSEKQAQRRAGSQNRTRPAGSNRAVARSPAAASTAQGGSRDEKSAVRRRDIREAGESLAEKQRALDTATEKVAANQAAHEDLAQQLLELDERRAELQERHCATTATLRDSERQRDRAAKARDTATRHLDTSRRATEH